MKKTILLNIEPKETRYAELKNGRLHNLIVERKRQRASTGNIYRGCVSNVLSNIKSAFIDIGEGENGFIHISDAELNTKKYQEMFDMDFDAPAAKKSKSKSKESDISELMKVNQHLLVQVVKEAIGSKGARLTSNISIAGRYLVLIPNSNLRGVSRKIEDRKVRDGLKDLIRRFELPKDMGLICRTASVNATSEMFIKEANELLKEWEEVVKNFNETKKPKLLYEEGDIIKRSLITAIDKKFDRIIVDDTATEKRLIKLYEQYKEEHTLEIERYRDTLPIFEAFRIEPEIERALAQKVPLKSGGYLIFEQTEAMHTIDVNSGRSTSAAGKNLEENFVQINIEAAEEIARQLRIRNLGGLVICDFIDMRQRRNQRRVRDALKTAMKEDSAKSTLLDMSEFGLVQMSRQRNRESLFHTIYVDCPYCNCRGRIKSNESMFLEISRSLRIILAKSDAKKLELIVHPEIESSFKASDRSYLRKIAEKMKRELTFSNVDSLHLNSYRIVNDKGEVLLDV